MDVQMAHRAALGQLLGVGGVDRLVIEIRILSLACQPMKMEAMLETSNLTVMK